jgi:ABC-type sugar transport system ATPase subunit
MSETDADSAETAAGAEATTETSQNVALRTDELTKYYGAIEAVKNVSIDLHRDEILAIAGDNGAGKSTFIKMLSGVHKPTAGDIYLRQEGELQKQYFSSSKDAMDAGIATVYQEQHLSPNAPTYANIFLGMEPLRDGLVGRLLRRVDEEYMIEESRKLLNDIGFDFDPRDPVNELSGGQKQAVAVARALIRDPPIIILDEPTSEVSTGGTDKIIDLVRQIPDGEKSAILISHKIDVVVDVADRIAVMRDGELIEVLDTNSDDVERIDIVERMHAERER